LVDALPTLAKFWLDKSESLSATLRHDAAISILATIYVVPQRELQQYLYTKSSEEQIVRLPKANQTIAPPTHPSAQFLQNFLSIVSQALSSMLNGPTGAIFPHDWWELVMFQLRTTGDFIWMSSSFMRSAAVGIFNPPVGAAMVELCRSFFLLCVSFITLPTLSPSNLPDGRREALWKRSAFSYLTQPLPCSTNPCSSGDLRVGATSSFAGVWKIAEPVLQSVYIDLVAPILTMSLVRTRSFLVSFNFTLLLWPV